MTRFRTRTRIAAAIVAFGLIGLSMFGLGLSAQGAPPAPAADPVFIGPPNNSATTDLSPQLDFIISTDTDQRIDVFADGSPYCTIPNTGIGVALPASCSGGNLALGPHAFTATSDYAGGPSIPSGTAGPRNVLIYDDSPGTFNFTTPTVDRNPEFSGTGPIGGTIEVYVMPGGPILCAAIPVDGAGNWSCEPPVALGIGGNTLRMTWTNAIGGGSFTTQGILETALTPPTIQDTHGPNWTTDEAQPAIQGSKDAGASTVSIEVSYDGGSQWFPYCTVNGLSVPPISLYATNWFCNNPDGVVLTNGANLFRATESNEAGEVSAAGPTLTITKVVSPFIGSPQDGFVTNDLTPTFDVVNAFGTTGIIWDVTNDTQLCSVPIVANAFSCFPAAPMAPGTYTVFAEVQPGFEVRSAEQTLTIDTTPPAAPVVNGPVSTNLVHPEITGTGEPGAQVSVQVDGALNACIPFGTAQVDSFGAWTCELSDQLAVDDYAIDAYQVDIAGNTGPVSAPPFALEIVPPTGTIQQTFPAWYTSSSFVQVQGTHSENTLYVQVDRADNPGGPWAPYCRIDYDAPIGGLTVWFCDEFDIVQGQLEPGPNYLRVTITADGGGTSAPSAPILITVVDPPVIGSPADGSIITDSTPSFSGIAPTQASFLDVGLGDESLFFCTNVPVAPDGSWSCTSGFIPDGHYTYGISTDIDVGNSGFTFTLDSTPPPFPVIDTPASPATTSDTTPTVGGSAVPGSEVTVWVDGDPVSCGSGSFQPSSGGRWACTIGPLPYGTYSIAAGATDSLGNGTGPSATQLRLTVGPPPLTLLKLNWKLGAIGTTYHPGDEVTLTGSGLPMGALAEAEIHSTPQSVGSAITDASGTFSIDAVIPKDIEPGQHTFVITVTAEGAETSTIVQPVTIMAPPVPPKASAESPLKKNPDNGSYADWQSLGDRNDPATPSVMTTSLDTFFQIITNPIFIATAGGIGLALLLFVAIPAELMNATIAEHYDRLTRRLPRRNAGAWARFKALLASTPVVGGIAVTALAAIIFGFADPGFGFDLTSLRVVLACGIGLFVVGFVANTIAGAIVGRRWKLDTVMEIQPLGLLLAIVGVVVSRLLGFSPGLLIGLLLGLSLVGRITKRDESRTAVVKAGVVWGLAVVAWLIYSPLAGTLAGSSFAGNLTLEAMVAVTTEGLTALLIGLLPFKFLEGSAIFANNKLLWVAVWLGAAATWAVIVLPQNFGQIQGSIWVWGAVVGGFAVVALAVYFIFRFAVKPEPEGETTENDIQKVRIGSGR